VIFALLELQDYYLFELAYHTSADSCQSSEGRPTILGICGLGRNYLERKPIRFNVPCRFIDKLIS
jgi:hypothetical protein